MNDESKSPREDFVGLRQTPAIRALFAALPQMPYNLTPAAGYAMLEEIEVVRAKTLQRLKSRKANGRYVAGEIEWATWVCDVRKLWAEQMIDMGLPDGFDWDREHVYVPMIGPDDSFDQHGGPIFKRRPCACHLCEHHRFYGFGDHAEYRREQAA